MTRPTEADNWSETKTAHPSKNREGWGTRQFKIAQSLAHPPPVEKEEGRREGSGGGGVVMGAFPGEADAADGFAEADGEIDDGFETLIGGGRKAVAMREEQLGIAEDAGEGIIEFVAENFGEIFGQLGPGGAEGRFGALGPATAADLTPPFHLGEVRVQP